MSPLAISGIVFACIFGGTLLGMVLRAVLPEHHLSAESRDVVKLGMGLIGTMTALVLGLLIASAKGSFDTQRNGLAQMSANMILLDRVLAHYGPEAKDARDAPRLDCRHASAHLAARESSSLGRRRQVRGPKVVMRGSTRKSRDSRPRTIRSVRSRPRR